MQKSTNFFYLPIFALVLISFFFVGPQNSSAWDLPPQIPGEYEGMWYGMYCDVPREKLVGMQPGTAFPDQKVINSWGYKGARPIEEIKDLLPELFYEVCTNPEAWGHIRINETAYIPLEKWPGNHQKVRMAATKANKGKASLDEKGMIHGYVNGFPFPGSEEGREIGWNFVKGRNYGDQTWITYYTTVVDKRGHTRYSYPETTYFWWGGRLHGDQVPNWEPNPMGYDLFNHMGWFSPYDLRGMVNLVHRYLDPDKQDDQWMYITSLRRVRRLSAAQRWDKLPGGNDITYDSATGFQGKPTNYEWKYLGRKQLLAGHNARARLTEIKGKPAGTIADQWYQRVNTKMVQYIPKIVSSVSRAVMYLDPESWCCYYVDYYDKRGRPYMFYAHCWAVDNDGNISPEGFFVADVQRIHSSNNNTYDVWFNEKAAEQGINPGYYEMNKLRNIYGGR